jgi:hypothetical protein
VFGVEGALTDWPMLPKRQVAERLWDLIADRFRAGREPPAPARSTRTRTRSTRRSTRQQDG